MARPVVDQALQKCVIYVVVASALTIPLTETSDVGGLIAPTTNPEVWRRVRVSVEYAVEPKAREKRKCGYGQSKGSKSRVGERLPDV